MIKLLILIIIFLYFIYNNKSNIYFLSKNETKFLFIKDYDNILNKQNDHDILNKWLNSISNFSINEQNKIISSINYVKKCINKYILDESFKNQLLSLDLIFSKTIGEKYLYGYAHTRLNIIFLTEKIIKINNIKQLSIYIIHEMSHIWQRIYKNDMIKWLQLSGYYIINKYNNDICCNPSINKLLFNPDIDNNIYNNIIILQKKYNNTEDLLYNYIMYYHPYELFAYKLQNIIK
jgi:hypothetical protein